MIINERVIKIMHGKFAIRMWCHCGDLSNYDEAEGTRRILRQEVAGINDNFTTEEAASILSCIPFCNAVEVVYKDEGIVIYPDWP